MYIPAFLILGYFISKQFFKGGFMDTLFSRAFPVSFIFVQWLCSVWYHWLIISFTHCRLNLLLCVVVDKSEANPSFLTLVCDLFFFSLDTWRTPCLSSKFLTRMYLDVAHPIPSFPQTSYISKFKFHYKCSLEGSLFWYYVF